MPVKLHSGALQGIDGSPVEVEVDFGPGFNKIFIVGMADTAVSEASERVKAALRNSGFSMPGRKVLVNLAPAAIPKEGAAFDLPIALGILVAEGRLKTEPAGRLAILGELSLEGAVRPTPGVLGIALRAKEEGLAGMIVPYGNREEAGLVEGLAIYPVRTLMEAVKVWNGEAQPFVSSRDFRMNAEYEFDYQDIKGQENGKRVMTIAAAGQHNVLTIGPPGAGKTMLAQRLPCILPPLTLRESIETTKIYSAAGLLPVDQPLVVERPFRAPHHTTSPAGLAGGGSGIFPRPGEISLSHNGVLFMDELPLFRRDAIDLLRGPIEDGRIVLSRAAGSIAYPARFQLVSAMNPCPCGYLGDPEKECHCSMVQVRRYRRKLTGPFVDRIDLVVEVPRIEYREMKRESGTATAPMRAQVLSARERQKRRYEGQAYVVNGRVPSRSIRKFCPLPEEAENMMEAATKKYALSPRAIIRVIRVARTIADLENRDKILVSDLAEALQYRGDEILWRE